MNFNNLSESNYSNHTMDFHGLDLTRDEKSYLDLRMEWLADKSPAHSSIDLHLKRVKDRVRGELIIKSLNNCFYAHTEDLSTLSTFRKLEKEIIKQIKEWRKNRFFKNNKFSNSLLTNYIAEEVSV